ncbi:MAG: molybdate ABC transporter substrate-binding protein [Cytophagaceae bacterium]
MKKVLLIILAIISLSCEKKTRPNTDVAEKTEKSSLLIYVGAASKPPTEEIVQKFEEETGISVEVIFGGSGYVMSQMKLSGKGDIYFPGSSDYMEIAKRENLVYADTEKEVVYLVNAINVQKGNPKNINSLKDLCKPGIKVAIANPEGVCVGAYAVEIIEKNFNADEKEQFLKNLSNYTESCDKTASAIALKTVDAVIGWSVFEHWNPELIETIPIEKDEIIRIGYIPIAIATYTKDKANAQKFIDYVVSKSGKDIFQKYRYFATPEEAEHYIGTKKRVGGEYIVPDKWLNR